MPASRCYLAFAQRRIPAFRTRWREFAVVGVINTAVPFALFAFAMQYLPASAGAILNATSPFFAAPAAAFWLGEALTWRKVAGITLGLAGVVVLVGWQPEGMTREMALAIAACLAASRTRRVGSTTA